MTNRMEELCFDVRDWEEIDLERMFILFTDWLRDGHRWFPAKLLVTPVQHAAILAFTGAYDPFSGPVRIELLHLDLDPKEVKPGNTKQVPTVERMYTPFGSMDIEVLKR